MFRSSLTVNVLLKENQRALVFVDLKGLIKTATQGGGNSYNLCPSISKLRHIVSLKGNLVLTHLVVKVAHGYTTKSI